MPQRERLTVGGALDSIEDPYDSVRVGSARQAVDGRVAVAATARPSVTSSALRRVRPVPALLAADVLACVLAALLAGSFDGFQAWLGALTLSGLGAARLYRRRLSLSALDDVPFVAAAVSFAYAGTLAFAGPSASQGAVQHWGRAAALAALLVVGRTVAYAAARALRRRGIGSAAIIVGAGQVGMQLARRLREHPEYGVTPVGFIDSNPRVAELSELPAPLLGDYTDLARRIEAFEVTKVLVAFGGVKEVALVDVLRTCDRLECEIFFVPRLFELHQTTRDMDQVWGIPLIRVRRAAFRSLSWRVKRVLDVLVAGLALLVLSPVLALCALAVRLEGGPGVLFRQVRVGLDGRPFEILKFRSLKPVDDSESQLLWNIKHDSRLGPVGKFLRATSLDELPQLWNILTGGMSLVGPRPERQHFVEQFTSLIPRYTARHRVPAGLTGWAQVHGLRGDTSIEDRANFDNYYIENWSLWGDVKIMLRTLGQVLRRAGG